MANAEQTNSIAQRIAQLAHVAKDFQQLIDSSVRFGMAYAKQDHEVLQLTWFTFTELIDAYSEMHREFGQLLHTLDMTKNPFTPAAAVAALEHADAFYHRRQTLANGTYLKLLHNGEVIFVTILSFNDADQRYKVRPNSWRIAEFFVHRLDKFEVVDVNKPEVQLSIKAV